MPIESKRSRPSTHEAAPAAEPPVRRSTGVRARRRWLLAATVLAGTATASGGAAAQELPAVVATVKPVHSLVAGVMGEIGTPTLLVRGGKSPHGFTLRPSDARALEQADLVFWIGPQLETFLPRALESLVGETATVRLLDAPGLTLWPVREGGAWEGHDHAHEGEAHDDHGHDDHGHEGEAHDDHDHDDDHAHDHDHAHDDDHAGAAIDGHVWLDPANARALVAAIADALAAVDPAHAEAYAANAAALTADLEALDAELAASLGPVADRPFVVFHDAYRGLEEYYGLNAVGSITVSPEIRPGAARLAEIRERIAELEAVCVFAEPQFPARSFDTRDRGAGCPSCGVLPTPLGRRRSL